MAKTLAELGEDWVSYGVSIVENPAVSKAKWIAIKSRHNEGRSMDPYIRQRRQELGLSQEAVAKKSGIGRVEISQLETRQRGLSANMATKMAEALETTPGALMARQLSSQGDAVLKDKGRSGVHRLIADLEDYRDSLGSDKEKAAFDSAIAELEKLLNDSGENKKPSGDDKAEKSQRRAARQGRDAHGRRRRDEDRADIGRDAATKNAARDSEGRKRDGYGRRR